MRNALLRPALLVGLAVASSSAARASPPERIVYLPGPSALAELATTNPEHYTRASKVIANAAQLCDAHVPPEHYYARFDARDVSCDRDLLKTSLPPQKVLSFTLDDTHYIAWVVVRGTHYRLTPAIAPAPRTP
jgi:hypothetical protein